MIIKKLLATKKLFKIERNSLFNPIKPKLLPDIFSYSIGKQKCIDALCGENPYEKAVIIEKLSGKILSEFSGDLTKCSLNLPKSSSPLIIVHGHVPVNGKTLPVSIQDFILMNDSNVQKLVAFNKIGQETYLQKKADFKPLNKSQIEQLKIAYLRHILSNASPEKVDKVKALIKYCIKNKNAKLIKQEIAENLNELQFSTTDLVEKFWKQNAPKLNLEYFSNFD